MFALACLGESAVRAECQILHVVNVLHPSCVILPFPGSRPFCRIWNSAARVLKVIMVKKIANDRKGSHFGALWRTGNRAGQRVE